LTAQEAEERNALAATRADWVVTSLRQAVEQVVNAAKEAASADLEDEIRAPVVAPPASASGDSVVEYPVVFDQFERPESGHEEPAAADHLRWTASPPRRGCSYEKQAEPECAGGHIGNRDKPARSTGSTR
jgi:hypothetical protein